MKTQFLSLLMVMFGFSTVAFAQSEAKSDEVIVKETTVIRDYNDVSKDGVINHEQPSVPQSVKDLTVIPTPVEVDGMATLAFWIGEDDNFTVLIQQQEGDDMEEHQIGKLQKGGHQLVIDMAGLSAGEYKVVVRGDKLYGSTNFTIK